MSKKIFCYFCFEQLENFLLHTKKEVVCNVVKSQFSNEEFPMFVTFKNEGSLRGCKGSFRALPLIEGLIDRTQDAASNDGRFSPIEGSELPHLSCSVSLLHSFEDATNPLDWEIGKHGIRLFLDGNSSTYLPHVALEHHWDKMEALTHLARKGGYEKKFGESELKRAKLERYQATRESATWEEYQQYLLTL